MLRIIRVLTLITLVTGCSNINIETKPDTFEIDAFDAFAEFTAPVNISIINAQTDTTDHVHNSSMGYTYSANMKSWTDTAVIITKRELIKRQATIIDGSKKRLELSIISIHQEWGFRKVRYITRLKVKTGDGYESIYIGNNNTGGTVYTVADGAVMRAVTDMFRDPIIVKYITSSN